jgi:hypothetical protein
MGKYLNMLKNHLGEVLYIIIDNFKLNNRKKNHIFIKKLKVRTKIDWENAWAKRKNKNIFTLCLIIQNEMKLPNYFLLPDDYMIDVLCDPTVDMRDVSTMIEIESLTIREIEDYNHMTMSDLVSLLKN